MTTARRQSLTRWIGFAAGVAAAVVLALSWQVPAEGGALGADARFVALPPGELTVEQEGTFLSARGLKPGGADASGRLELRNISPRSGEFRLFALPSGRDLDSALRVELRLDGRSLANASLGELREGSDAFALAPGETGAVEARAWLPESARGYEGRSVDVTVELRTES